MIIITLDIQAILHRCCKTNTFSFDFGMRIFLHGAYFAGIRVDLSNQMVIAGMSARLNDYAD
jgi:hypothetical protein